MTKKVYTLKERVNIMCNKIEKNYGPHRLRRMAKEEREKMSLLFGIERKEREKFHNLIEEQITIGFEKNKKLN